MHSRTLIALLGFIPATASSPLSPEAQAIPPGMSVIVLKSSGCTNGTAGAQLSSSGDSLSVEYVNFTAYTDATGNFEPPICAVTLAVSYTAGWSFTVSNLRVDGDIQLSQGASAQITVSSFFDPTLRNSDYVALSGPRSGGYIAVLKTLDSLSSTGRCGATSSLLHVETQLNITGSASDMIDLNTAAMDISWAPCR